MKRTIRMNALKVGKQAKRRRSSQDFLAAVLKPRTKASRTSEDSLTHVRLSRHIDLGAQEVLKICKATMSFDDSSATVSRLVLSPAPIADIRTYALYLWRPCEHPNALIRSCVCQSTHLIALDLTPASGSLPA